MLISSLPKIGRSRSEPILTSSHSEDLDAQDMCASPKTPINSHYNQFSLFNYWETVNLWNSVDTLDNLCAQLTLYGQYMNIPVAMATACSP